MKALVLGLALAMFACGGKKKNAADSNAIDIYVNVDLAPHLAKVNAARAAYDGVRATDIDSQPDKMKWLFREVAAPFLSQAIAGASAITPPPAAKEVHEAALSLWKKERDIIGAMAAATDPVDAEKFKAAHAQMMELQESVMTWDRRLQALLDASGGLKLKPLPDVNIPEPKLDDAAAPAAAEAPAAPVAPAASAAPAAPAPATAAVTPKQCKAGTDMESPADDGSYQCLTEQTFNPPPAAPAGTPKASVLLCGPGRLEYDKTGRLLSCINQVAITIGTSTIDAGNTITLSEDGTRMVVIPQDHLVCFDAAGKPARCSGL